MNKLIVVTFFSVSLFLGSVAICNDKLIQEVYRQYDQGAYVQTIDLLSKLATIKSFRQKALYWKALCYLKLQDYEKANNFFAKVIDYNKLPKESHYEYAQSLFATNRFGLAKKQFEKSFKKGVKRASSLYYIAYMYQLDDRYKLAAKKYVQINKLPKIDPNIKQASNFQLGEVLLSFAEKNSKGEKRFVRRKVIPQMQKALELDEESSLALEINKRIYEVQKKYNLIPEVSTKPYSLTFDQDLEYDSNVTLTPDNTTNTTATEESSPVSKTKLRGQYTFNWSGRVKTSPELLVNYDKYMESSEPAIYQNDSLTLGLSVRNSIAHHDKHSFLFDLEYSYIKQDYLMQKSLSYYGKFYSLVIGENLNIFSLGNSILKGKYQKYYSYSESNDSCTWSLNFTQFFKLKSRQLVLFIMDYSSNDSNTDMNDSASLLLRVDYFRAKLFHKTNLQTGLAVTLIDTKLQKETRGLEKNISPLIKITRKLSKKIELGLRYNYTRNISKSEDIYQYSKHVAALNFKVRI